MDIKDRETVNLLRERLALEIEPGLLTEKYDTDYNLLRWLQGYDFNLDSVIPKLRYHLRFRKAWDLDNITENSSIEKSIAHQAWPGGVVGVTGKSDNALLRMDPAGKLDAVGLLKSVSIPDIMRTLIYIFEQILQDINEQERKTGKQSGIVNITDYDGLKFEPCLVGIVTGPLKCLALFLPDHYVEMFQKFVLINVPPCFYYLWKLIRPLLPEKTKQKICILGKNWKKEIRSFVEPSFLPKHWGGTMPGDSKCCAKVKMPPWPKIPLQNYRKAGIHTIASEGRQFKTFVLSAGKTEMINIKVENPGSKIRFVLVTNSELSFGVFHTVFTEEFASDIDKMDMVWPLFNRLTDGCEGVPFEENFVCKKAGIYKFWFGNEFSWWSSVKISIWIEIIE